MKRRLRSGFTLAEVLVIVVILWILAATVLPQLTPSTRDARESALRRDLQKLRSAISVYSTQHDDKPPALGTTDASLFVGQLTQSSDAAGAVGEIGTKPFGPYLVGQMAINPYNDLRTVKVVNSVWLGDPDDATGWIYSSVTGQIKANTATITAADGTPVESL